MNLEMTLLPCQEDFVLNDTDRYVALKGGYGTGKTQAFCYKAIRCAAINYGKYGAMMSPTLNMANKTLVPKMHELLGEMGIQYVYKKSAAEFRLKFGKHTSIIYILSAENYDRLRGLNLAWAGIDEIDTIRTDIAHAAWEQVQARLRDGAEDGFEQAFCVSTPEGFGFMYQWFHDDVEKAKERGEHLDRKLYTASTYDNYTLKPSFIESLKEGYPLALIEAYLNGNFVNLTGNPVYSSFERTENGCTNGLEHFSGSHGLWIGMDFNVNDMSAVCGIIADDGKIFIVDEIYGLKNTRTMIEEIRRRYGTRPIYICPDASAVKGSSNSDTTDMQMLRQSGFTKILHQGNNPRVQDRVNNVNRLLCDATGKRRLFINTQKCPITTAALIQQIYDPNTQQPDKHDHKQDGPMDALGYFLWQAFPQLSGPKVTIK